MDSPLVDAASASEALARSAFHLRAAKMYSLASFVMVYYDIFLTFGQEVERIWLQPEYNRLTLLWALNRYLLPLGYIVIVVSFHQRWSHDVCDRYVLYPEALKIVATTVIGIIFIMRVGAIYGKNQRVMIFVWLLLAAQIAMKIWAFTDGVRLNLPDELIGCILVGRHHLRIAFTWIAELMFDTVIFALTLWRTIRMYKMQLNHNRPMSLFMLIIRDGIVYFGVIFAANLVNTLVFLLAPDDLKAINASFSTLITTLMVSRLILNLKSAARKNLTESDRSAFGGGPARHQKVRSLGGVGLASATAISVHVETHIDFGNQANEGSDNPEDIEATKRNSSSSKSSNIKKDAKHTLSPSQSQYELSHISYSQPFRDQSAPRT